MVFWWQKMRQESLDLRALVYEKFGFKTDGLRKTEKREDFELREIRYGMIL